MCTYCVNQCFRLFYLSAFKRELLFKQNFEMEKFLKNPVYTGAAIFLILVVVVAFVWDQSKNPKKDMFGLLKSTPVV